MKFSILIPSRGRPQMLQALMESIISRAFDREQIEFLIKIDDDDVNSGYSHLLADNFKDKVSYRLFIGKQTDNLSQDYYNFMAKEAYGGIVWALNDDCILHGSQFWDRLILSEVEQKSLNNKIFYVNVGVSGHTDEFSPFPMLSREAIAALGYFHHHLIKTWDGDVVLWNTFNGLKNMYGINRMIDLRQEMTVIHYNGNGQMHDATRENMKRGHQTNGGMNAADFNGAGLYIPSIEKLKKGIDNEK